MQTLEELPRGQASIVGVQRPVANTRYRLDAEVDLSIGDKEVTLLIEIKRAVYPRDVRQILWQLEQAQREYPGDVRDLVPLLAAESISVGARDLLRERNIGFFDSGGSLFVPGKSVYLYIEKPVPKPLEKSIRTLFTGKRSQVLHALLVTNRDWFGVTELAHLSEVAPSTASETLTALDRMEWLDVRGQGPTKERRVSDPTGLLNEWRTQILTSRRSTVKQQYYVPGGDIGALLHRLAKLCESVGSEYALTQEVGAQAYAPFLTHISRIVCRLPPGKAATEVMAGLEARIVSEGANLDVIETKSRNEFLFKEYKNGVWLASPLQVYLDLLRGSGRSKDMAENLRKEILRF